MRMPPEITKMKDCTAKQTRLTRLPLRTAPTPLTCRLAGFLRHFEQPRYYFSGFTENNFSERMCIQWPFRPDVDRARTALSRPVHEICGRVH